MRSAEHLVTACHIIQRETPATQWAMLESFTREELAFMLDGFRRDNPGHLFVNSLIRAYALKDLYFFCTYVLGYDHTRPSPDPNNPSVDLEPGLHGEMCELVISSPARKRLFLVPRGHLKSTVLTVGHTIWLLCRNPNLRILLVSATGPTAESFLAEVKAHFENNKLFRSLFPDRLPTPSSTWNNDAIQVGGRTIAAGVNSVEARGIDGNIVGRHYDYCKADDLVTKDNVTTNEQRQKIINAFQALESVMEPYATWDVIGTRWHYYEMYQWLIDAKAEAERVGIESRIMLYVRKAIEDGVPIFPAKYSKERLMEIKATQQELYAKLYDNSPLPDEDREFRPSMFYLYTREEIEPLLHLMKHRGTAIDLAVTTKTRSDYSVVGTGTMHPEGNLVILDIDRGKVSTDKVADWMLRQMDMWGSRVGYEAQGQQAMFETIVNLVAEKRKRHITMVKLKGSATSNEARIRGLLPLIGKKQIWLPKDNPHSQETIDEFLHFPVGRHDDLSTVVAYLPQMVRPNRVRAEAKEAAYEPDSELTGY